MYQTLGMTYLIACFEKNLIIFAQCNAEDDGRDVFEAVYPLLAFTPLATNIKHTVIQGQLFVHIGVPQDCRYLLYAELAHLEAGFIDTRCFCSCS